MIAEVCEFAGLLHRKTWSRERLEDLRRTKLRRLVHHAYENVPYYRRLMDKAGVKPAEIREPADLSRLPVTTKRDLRLAEEDCLARGHGELTVLHTSGHSGAPFAVRLKPAEYQTRRLREFRMLIGTGVRPRDRLTLLGPVRTRPNRLHRSLGFYRMEVIPAVLSDQEQLRRFRVSNPDVLWAYPQTLEALLFRAGCSLRDLARPRFLITSSEVMRPVFWERLRAEMPEMEIVHIYGSAEAGRIAAQCRARHGLHLEEDALIVEILDKGSLLEPGREGSVAVTCLDQLAMPLIRYEQGDICRLRTEPCGCGWQTPVMDPPIGRNSDWLTLPCGTKVASTRLEVSLRHENDLLQFRFVQERLDGVRAQLCFRRAPTPEKLAELKTRMETAAGGDLRVDIELLPEMQFEGIKFKVFVSKL